MEFVKSTPIFNCETCPNGIKKRHKLNKGFIGKLIVISGQLEFIYEDENKSHLIDKTKKFEIEELREHHVNLIGDVQFKIEFYKK